jgi:hypothetical protein
MAFGDGLSAVSQQAQSYSNVAEQPTSHLLFETKDKCEAAEAFP